jgi:hypothetical protein
VDESYFNATIGTESLIRCVTPSTHSFDYSPIHHTLIDQRTLIYLRVSLPLFHSTLSFPRAQSSSHICLLTHSPHFNIYSNTLTNSNICSFAHLPHSHTYTLLPTRSCMYPSHVLLSTHLFTASLVSISPWTHWPLHLSPDVQREKLNCVQRLLQILRM